MEIVALERVCARGWPGTASRELGAWLLRAGHGFTGRANSALVLGSPPGDLGAAVDEVVRWYAAQGLPARFQLPTGDGLPPEILAVDTCLEAAGWTVGDDVAVLVGEIGAVLGLLPPAPAIGRRRDPAAAVTVSTTPDAGWLQLYRYRGRPLPGTARAVLAAGPDPQFLTLRQDGSAVAVVRTVVTDGWLGITALTVPAEHRRRGHATRLVAAALADARSAGAQRVYLQVSRDNAGALALYRGLGFTEHHAYRYRDLPRA